MKKEGSDLLELLEADPIKQLNQVPEYKIYCDMDGVLTNFEGQFMHYAGMTPEEYTDKHGAAAMWELIDVKIGLVYWSKMPWMSHGKELWNFIKDYSPEVLTSPSRDDVSRLGKNIWIKDNLTPTPKVVFSLASEKQQYATPSAILIDDKDSTIAEWTAAGGIAIHCKNGDSADVIKQLRELGY